MDYSKFLGFHRRSKADVTIAVREVAWNEANRFGIMSADSGGRIVDFEEKPAAPKSNKASMGVYVFNWPVMKRYLIADAANPKTKNDFGKNIIPNMLADGLKMMAYGFGSYWMDVGTIESLWEANMDLIKDPPAFDLRDKAWRMYARNPIMPPHYTAETASVSESLVTEGCDVSGVVERSVLFAGVLVESGAYVKDSVVMPGARILSGATLTHAIVGENAVVTARCVVGADPVEGKPLSIALVGQNAVLPEGYVVKPGDQVDAGALLAESGAKA
jgi:glucose-1-phosphate adenylyltransferase